MTYHQKLNKGLPQINAWTMLSFRNEDKECCETTVQCFFEVLLTLTDP